MEKASYSATLDFDNVILTELYTKWKAKWPEGLSKAKWLRKGKRLTALSMTSSGQQGQMRDDVHTIQFGLASGSAGRISQAGVVVMNGAGDASKDIATISAAIGQGKGRVRDIKWMYQGQLTQWDKKDLANLVKKARAEGGKVNTTKVKGKVFLTPSWTNDPSKSNISIMGKSGIVQIQKFLSEGNSLSKYTKYIENISGHSVGKSKGVGVRDKSCKPDTQPEPYSFSGVCKTGYYVRPNKNGNPCCYKIPKDKKAGKLRAIQAYKDAGVAIPPSVRTIFGITNTPSNATSLVTKAQLVNKLEKKGFNVPNGATMNQLRTMLNKGTFNAKVGQQKYRITKSEWKQVFDGPWPAEKKGSTVIYRSHYTLTAQQRKKLQEVRAVKRPENLINRRKLINNSKNNELLTCVQKHTKPELKRLVLMKGMVVPKRSTKASLCKRYMRHVDRTAEYKDMVRTTLAGRSETVQGRALSILKKGFEFDEGKPQELKFLTWLGGRL